MASAGSWFGNIVALPFGGYLCVNGFQASFPIFVLFFKSNLVVVRFWRRMALNILYFWYKNLILYYYIKIWCFLLFLNLKTGVLCFAWCCIFLLVSSDEPKDHWFISKIEKEYIIKETKRIAPSKQQVSKHFYFILRLSLSVKNFCYIK